MNRPPSGTLGSDLSRVARSRISTTSISNGTFETAIVPAGEQRCATRTDLFDPDRHQPYINEAIVGYRRQLPGQLSAGVSFSVRDYRDAVTSYEVNGIYEDNVFKGYGALDVNAERNLPDHEQHIQFEGLHRPRSAGREADRVAAGDRQLHASVAARLRGVPAERSSVVHSARTRFRTTRASAQSSGADNNSLSGGSQVAGLAWRDHAFRIAGKLQSAVGTSRLHDLRRTERRLVRPDRDAARRRRSAIRTGDGPGHQHSGVTRNVSNPLATRIRFAFPTRGEGQHKSPTVHYWTLRLGRNFGFAGQHLETAVEVYNVMNLGGDYSPLVPGTNQTFNANYKLSTFRQPPRAVQLLLRYAF